MVSNFKIPFKGENVSNMMESQDRGSRNPHNRIFWTPRPTTNSSSSGQDRVETRAEPWNKAWGIFLFSFERVDRSYVCDTIVEDEHFGISALLRKASFPLFRLSQIKQVSSLSCRGLYNWKLFQRSNATVCVKQMIMKWGAHLLSTSHSFIWIGLRSKETQSLYSNCPGWCKYYCWTNEMKQPWRLKHSALLVVVSFPVTTISVIGEGDFQQQINDDSLRKFFIEFSFRLGKRLSWCHTHVRKHARIVT